jgi:hypothetical protein
MCSRQVNPPPPGQGNADPDGEDGEDGRDHDRDELRVMDHVDRRIADGPRRGQVR